MSRLLLCLGVACLGIFGTVDRSDAQSVVPDHSSGTIVTSNNANFTITGGIRSGNHLFHSFREFSIPTGASASFNNATDIQNIFSRVTGGTASNIDGTIRANGTANLFLLNPSGILFGSNAQLNIGGSFVGTTAQAIKFADDTEFGVVNKQPPLLTMSAPIGLQMGQNPAEISVQGQGHSLKFLSTFAPVAGGGQSPNGLQVSPGQTLALIGGNLTLVGGVLTAPAGQIELGGVANGTVSLNTASNRLTFGYESIQSFRDLQLTERSAIDTSGFGRATVQLVGRKIALTNGSIVLMVNQAPQLGGNLNVIASETFQLSGRSSVDPEFGSFLISDAFAGSTANISLTAPQLLMHDRGMVTTRTFGEATGGSINVKASTIQIDGKDDNAFEIHSGFLPTAIGKGNMGAFTLSAQNLSLTNGGYINASTLGSGSGSEVVINADTIRIDGVNSLGQSSLIAAAAFSSGNAGSLTINARELALTNGGTASTSTFDSGKAGNVTILATDSTTVAGRAIESLFSTTDGIGSSANILPLSIRKLIGLPARPSGNSGDVIITTNRLAILDGGEVKVDNQGSGNAGTVWINAQTINLKDRGSITAATTLGTGGNIDLQARSLFARNQSSITATSGEFGSGGNIRIDAPIILGLENSDITANAVQGRGGNINITTQGMIGLRYRDRRTSESDITASSELGISGTVQINNIGVDPNSGLVELLTNLVDTSQQVVQGCSTSQGSSFVVTGRGGIPLNPMEQMISSDRTWDDLRTHSFNASATVTVLQSQPLLEATSWHRNPQTGKIELTAARPVQSPQNATCN